MNYVQLLQISCCKSQLFLAVLNLIKPSANDSFIFQLPISKKAASEIKSLSLVDILMSKLWKFHLHIWQTVKLSFRQGVWNRFCQLIVSFTRTMWVTLILLYLRDYTTHICCILYLQASCAKSICTVEAKKSFKCYTVFKQNVWINVFSRKAKVTFPVGMPH